MSQHGTIIDCDKPASRPSRLAFAGKPAVLLLLAVLAIVAGLAAAIYSGFGDKDVKSQAVAVRDSATPPLVLPQSDPVALRPLTREQAVQWNDTIPVAEIPNPSAKAFKTTGVSPIDFNRSLDCMTAAVYYEAASESDDGQRAVAQIVLNRVRHPAFPHTVCGVVFQGYERRTGCQFSFSCDGAMARPRYAKAWDRARRVAAQALSGAVYAPVGWATHYHTDWVVPYWSSTLLKTAQIGAHIFYRWAGGWGTPRAFTSRYAAAEPISTLPPGWETGPGSELVSPLVAGEVVTVSAVDRPVLNGNLVPAKATVSTRAVAADPDRAVANSERPIFGAAGTPVAHAPVPPASN